MSERVRRQGLFFATVVFTAVALAFGLAAVMMMVRIARAQSVMTESVMTGSDLSTIDQALSQTPGIKLLRTFPGPGGLTGILMSVHGKKMIAYLTPGGRYMIEGVVMNIATGQNVTAADASQYAGSGVVPMPQNRITQILSRIEKMHGISTRQTASNAVYLVFNPSGRAGEVAFSKMWRTSLGSNPNITCVFIPYGSPVAGWLLSGTYANQMTHLGQYYAHPTMQPVAGQVTSSGNRSASENARVAAKLAVHPPLLGLVLPSLRIENVIRAVPGKSLDRGGIAQAGGSPPAGVRPTGAQAP
ncbi:MAG: hypothetical protein PHZ23_15565 [Acidiphilium sp.]|nr:hypothetical protein [Acidiphilium sp.]